MGVDMTEDEQITAFTEHLEKATRQIEKFKDMHSQDPEIEEGYNVIRTHFRAKQAQCARALRQLGALDPLPPDLQEA